MKKLFVLALLLLSLSGCVQELQNEFCNFMGCDISAVNSAIDRTQDNYNPSSSPIFCGASGLCID